jgi:hypothetical protein
MTATAELVTGTPIVFSNKKEGQYIRPSGKDYSIVVNNNDRLQRVANIDFYAK